MSSRLAPISIVSLRDSRPGGRSQSLVQHAWSRTVRRKQQNHKKWPKKCMSVFNSTDFVVDWPLQTAITGLLFSYACFVQRPRGWADSSLVEVGSAANLLL